MAQKPHFIPRQATGGVLTALGALAAVVQLLDYAKSGKLNLILATAFGAVAVAGVVMILAQKARSAALIGAGLAIVVIIASYGAVAFYNTDDASPTNEPVAKPTSVAGGATPTTFATESTSASPVPSGQPEACPSAAGPLVEMHDDFEDGRVDLCKWDVKPTMTSQYHEQPGIRILEQEGMLVFDVAPPLEAGDDVELFARPMGKVTQEVSADLQLLSNSGKSAGGSAGIIANLGDDGPIVALDGGPGDNGAGHDISLCPSDGATYDECQHPPACGSLDLQAGVAVRLRIVRTASGVESYIGDTPCGVFPVAHDIKSVNLNLYAETGSGFRMAIDNFYMRYVL